MLLPIGTTKRGGDGMYRFHFEDALYDRKQIPGAGDLDSLIDVVVNCLWIS